MDGDGIILQERINRILTTPEFCDKLDSGLFSDLNRIKLGLSDPQQPKAFYLSIGDGVSFIAEGNATDLPKGVKHLKDEFYSGNTRYLNLLDIVENPKFTYFRKNTEAQYS